MTKGFKFFILLFFMCMSFTFLSACNQTNSSFIIDYEKNAFQVGEETFVSINSSSTIEVEWSSSDNNIASVDEYGVIKFKAVGFVTITATNLDNQNDFASVDFIVTDAIVTNIIINGEMSGSVGETLSFSYKLEPKKSTAELFWESDNTGIATIKVTAVDDGMFSTTFKIGIFDYNTIIVDSSLDKEVGEKITYNGKDYYAGFTYVNSLKQAVNSIKENGTIYVLKGKYSESFAINTNGVKIYGANYENGSFEDTSNNDSIIDKMLILGTNVDNVEIKGLTFIGEGTFMLYGNNDNILIANNKFLENAKGDGLWYAYKGEACINFVADDLESNDITIINNYFKDINIHGIALYKYKNLKITNNIFENFKLDAIREYNGESLSSGQLLIRNNDFINGGYNAIFFNMYGPMAASYEKIISIYDNEFKNVSKTIEDVDYYAINFNEFHGGTVSVSLKYNSFENCINNIKFEKNERENLDKNLNAYVNYNKFVSDNVKYIINNGLTKNINYEYNYIGKNNGSEFTNINNLFVGTNIGVNKISLTEFNDAVRVYGKNSMNVDSETTYIIEDEQITWISNNPSIVSIDLEGNAKALKTGIATLQAYKNGKVITNLIVDVFDSLNIDYASLLVSIALEEEGYVEGANNYSKYGEWYGQKYGKEFANGAWCAMFVSWCANQANISTTIIPEYALCSAGEQWFKSRDAFGYKGEYTPKTGDIVFFTSAGAGHTGIVVKCENGKLYTIEGNTSNMCAQRSYDLNYKTITGYGTPKYPVYTGEKIDFDVSSSTSGAGQTTQ